MMQGHLSTQLLHLPLIGSLMGRNSLGLIQPILSTLAVHKRPASLIPENALFDKTVAHLRIRSEHCMGALKGRFQCLRGLRVDINTKADHVAACRWITIAIILHNLIDIIDVEGTESVQEFLPSHSREQELDDRGIPHAPQVAVEERDPEAKRMQLVQELVAYQEIRRGT